MTMTRHAEKRLPRPTPLTEAWWAACRKHELLIQRCVSCGIHQFYPRSLCAACGSSDVKWVRGNGNGRVESYTVIRHPVSKAYAPEVPYAIALVRLDEGPRMMASLSGVAIEDVAVDMAVEVVFEQWTEEVTMPLFRPTGGR